VSDFYFKDGLIPDHDVVDEVSRNSQYMIVQ